MVLKRIGVLSLAKIMGVLYAAIGLIVGFFVSFAAVIGSVIGSSLEGTTEPLVGLFLGVGAIFFFPILYGVLGFIGGAITSAIYNFVSKFTGGLELEFEGESAAPSQY